MACAAPSTELGNTVFAIGEALKNGPRLTADDTKKALGAEAQALVNAANALLNHLEARGVPGLRDALDRSGTGNDPALIRRLADLAHSRNLVRPR